MPKGEDITTRYKVDISDLKKGITEANKNIKLANAQFKAASAGMDDWQKSSNGLTAKLQQLKTVLTEENNKLTNYKKQLEQVEKAENENGKKADELKAKLAQLANQGVAKTSEEYKKYANALMNIEKEQIANQNAADKLRITILNQQATVNKTEKEIRNYSAELNKLENETTEVKKDTEDLNKKFEGTKKNSDDAGKGFTILNGTLANLCADGIKKVVSGLKDIVTEAFNVAQSMSSASKKFTNETGLSEESVKKFNEQMLDLYKKNYGENLSDIADKMAYVKQVTRETDPSKVKDLVENAMNLEEVFGSDFKETVRGVSNLMNHFGIDSTTAFDLFAKGSQLGLDYTSELGDNVAEYAGNFKQAGYTATEYFQLLANGSQSGAYNLDKVNDSINEIKNRLGDGTIKENLSLFSSSTKKAFSNWEKRKRYNERCNQFYCWRYK